MTATPAKGDERVRIYEVGPRDGLQNEASVLPVAVKAIQVRDFFNRLSMLFSEGRQ